MTTIIGRLSAMRITRLDEAGRPIGDPIALTGRVLDVVRTGDEGDPVAVETWTHPAESWHYTLRFTHAHPHLFHLVMGWRTPSPLLARHRRRRHK